MPVSMRGAAGHVQVTNAGSLAAARPADTCVFTLYGIAKVNSDLAGPSVMTDVTYDGGGDAAVCYTDGGDNVAYVATVLGGAANTIAALASRPTSSDSWYMYYLQQNGSGANLIYGTRIISVGTWVKNNCVGLTNAQAAAVYNISLNSNSNRGDYDCVTWRAADAILSEAQIVDDLNDGTALHADIWHWEFNGGVVANAVDVLSSGATIATQGGALSDGATYTYPGRGGATSILRQMLMHQQH
jgi:hypothetical protein